VLAEYRRHCESQARASRARIRSRVAIWTPKTPDLSLARVRGENRTLVFEAFSSCLSLARVRGGLFDICPSG